jgi:outer membrane protein OmpA-like peptidoglycan-associated protein
MKSFGTEGCRVTRIGCVVAGLTLLALTGCETSHPRYAGPLIAAPAACADIVFPIYFEPGSAAITHEADGMIASARKRAAACRVTAVDVVGLADAAGAPGANLALSERRADAVTKALSRNGFSAAPVRVAAAGAMDASTDSGEARPLRRRADVTIRLAPH